MPGYERAWNAIFDSNITTFLSGLILFQFGTGPVRGFAVTLCVGILTSDGRPRSSSPGWCTTGWRSGAAWRR